MVNRWHHGENWFNQVLPNLKSDTKSESGFRLINQMDFITEADTSFTVNPNPDLSNRTPVPLVMEIVQWDNLTVTIIFFS